MAIFRPDRAAIRRSIRDASMSELRVQGPRVVNRAKILCPVDSGRLRASIKGEPFRTWTFRPGYRVWSDVEYAPFVHDGTPEFKIRPKAGRQGKPKAGGGYKPTYLRFLVNGRWVYAREVTHPAVRARPFLDRALREIATPRGYSVRND